MDWLLVGIGGFVGSCLRYGIGRLLALWPQFPWGTFAANAFAGLGAGLVAGFVRYAALPEHARLLLAVGMMGGLSTFSTFSVETVQLLEARRGLAAAGNVALNLTVCLGLAAAGFLIARGLKSN